MLYIFVDYWMDWVRLDTVISYVILVMLNVTIELSNVSKKKKKTTKYDKNTIIYDVETA